MLTALQKKRAAAIMYYYGRNNQLDILQEECAELIQAVSKIRRRTPGAEEHFIDEMADVSIMLEEFLSDFDDDEKTEFYKKVNEKTLRQQDRIVKEKGAK